MLYGLVWGPTAVESKGQHLNYIFNYFKPTIKQFVLSLQNKTPLLKLCYLIHVFFSKCKQGKLMLLRHKVMS